MPSRPRLASATPGRSSLSDGPCVSFRRLSASGIRTMPSGTLSQKIHCQERPETTAPPTSGPSATARPPIPLQAPSASPRFAAGTDAERIVSVSGAMIAPPTPCSGAGGDESVDRRRQRGRGRGGGEDSESDREHPAPPEAVAERSARQEEHREGQRVGVHGPLEPLDAGPEVLADHGQGCGDDEVVEGDHHERERRDDECPDGAVGLHLRSSFVLSDCLLTSELKKFSGLTSCGRRAASSPTARRRRAGPSPRRR